MARKMKKFSAGGAQGRYDRRMADIEKDYAKAMTRKTGKAAEVAEAKRQQRIADAKDDLAKRTGADRTATRAAEKLAESNLTKTRKYGAPQAVSKLEPIASEKITETLSLPKSGLATSTKKAPAKVAAKSPAKPDINNPSMSSTRARLEAGRADFRKQQQNRRRIAAAAEKEPVTKFDKAAFSDLKTGKNSYGAANLGKSRAPAASSALMAPKGSTSRSGSLGDIFKTSDAFKKSQEAKYGKRTPLISGTDTDSLITYGDAAAKKNAANKAKGGKIMKKPAKAKAKPFAATKFGAAMVKKSADTKGRAMVKKAGGGKCYAKGGSIDGIAIKGKTKAKRVTMKKGGKC